MKNLFLSNSDSLDKYIKDEKWMRSIKRGCFNIFGKLVNYGWCFWFKICISNMMPKIMNRLKIVV